MGTLAKVALFECERLLCFGFVCFLCFFGFAEPAFARQCSNEFGIALAYSENSGGTYNPYFFLMRSSCIKSLSRSSVASFSRCSAR